MPPTREEALAEAYRRGLMPPAQRSAYREAIRRGVVPNPSPRNRQQQDDRNMRVMGQNALNTLVQTATGLPGSDGGTADALRTGNGLLTAGLRLFGQGEAANRANSILAPLADEIGAPADRQRRSLNVIAPPENEEERFAARLGANAPNALLPGSWLTRAASVLLPTAGGTVGRAVGGDTGEVVGTIAGGLISPVRVARPPAATPAARVLSSNPRQTARMIQRQAELQSAGATPTAADITSVGGRRRIRDVALRGDDSQEAVANFNRDRRLNLPARMDRVAERTMSNDNRTPDQIRAEIVARRKAQADRQYGAVRGDTMTMQPETVSALRSDYGRAAIREAARRERDPETRAALLRLAEDAIDNPSTQVTVGMMDRISRVLLSQAEGARAVPDMDLATTIGNLGSDVRNPTRAASPGYGQAVDNYAAESRMVEAADLGEGFLAHNTDQFAAAAGQLTPEQQTVALATARRNIQTQAGERIGGAPGVAESIAHSGEQHTRNVSLLGPERAGQLERGMDAEHRLTMNARAVDPQTGSQTQPNTLTQSLGTAHAVVAAVRGNPIPLTTRAFAWLTNRGFSEAEATQAVTALTDPAQTDAILRALEARGGTQIRFEFERLLLPGSAAALAPVGSE